MITSTYGLVIMYDTKLHDARNEEGRAVFLFKENEKPPGGKSFSGGRAADSALLVVFVLCKNEFFVRRQRSDTIGEVLFEKDSNPPHSYSISSLAKPVLDGAECVLD